MDRSSLENRFTDYARIILENDRDIYVGSACDGIKDVLSSVVTGDLIKSSSFLQGLYEEYYVSSPRSDSLEKERCDFGDTLSPSGAAACLKDVKRTKVFARGLKSAIEKMMKMTDERPIRVLDAGCGPYGLLSMLVAPFFKEGEVEFSLLDIYKVNVECSMRVAEVIGQIAKCREFIKADAVQHRIEGRKPHVIISETMQTRLSVEPQVAITANLGDQLADGGIFLPQSIRIYAEMNDQELGELFILTSAISAEVKDSCGRIVPNLMSRISSVKKKINAGRPVEKGEKVVVKTEVRVFEDHVLKSGESEAVTGSFNTRTLKSESGDITFEFEMGTGKKVSEVFVS